MKPLKTSLLWIVALTSTFAYAQNNNISQVQHVIVVIQENRTPTNLFHEDATLVSYGAHVIPPGNQAACGKPAAMITGMSWSCTSATENKSIPLTGLSLVTPVDPDHSHYPAWYCTYNGGLMDGACHIKVTQVAGSDISGCPVDGNIQYCPYTYVTNDIQSNGYGILTPYFSIAEQYGFANWMFQTHQGPSQEAHQFLFAGTSAPNQYNYSNGQCETGGYCQFFASENPKATAAGCTAPINTVALELPPAPPQDPVWQAGYVPPGGTAGYPCYNPHTLIDLLTPNGISWRYYAGSTAGPNKPYAIWRTPDLIQDICQPSPTDGPGDVCTYAGYTTNVYTGNPAVVLQDLGYNGANCDLQQVSWVIPDGSWSDHPGGYSFDAGPSWVAAIVNAVGNYTNFGAQLRSTPCSDTINGQQVPYWQDTVVLVVWDDWGGFYDDVLPWNCSNQGVCSGYPGQSQSEDYVYGFRVPLLVVGAYTNQICTPSTPPVCHGYISGTAAQGGETPPYVHDFGSILNFIEYAFGQNLKHLGDPGGIGGTAYPYADWFAPDAPHGDCGSSCVYSLSDFFTFTAPPHAFSVIPGAKYDTGCFVNPGSCFPAGQYPADPDDDAIDPQ